MIKFLNYVINLGEIAYAKRTISDKGVEQIIIHLKGGLAPLKIRIDDHKKFSADELWEGFLKVFENKYLFSLS